MANKQLKLFKEEKSFGFTFAGVFLLLTAILTLKSNKFASNLLIVSSLFFVVTLIRPQLFKYPNMIWMKFGLTLHKVMTPIVLAAMFFIVFFPMGVVLRTIKLLSFEEKSDANLSSYWKTREQSGPKPETMKLSF